MILISMVDVTWLLLLAITAWAAWLDQAVQRITHAKPSRSSQVPRLKRAQAKPNRKINTALRGS